MPGDLRDRALARIVHARTVVGPLHLHRIISVDPLWRPLVKALASVVEITWDAPGTRDRSWFPGTILGRALQPAEHLTCEVCADPRAEVVEALRWARALLSDGRTQACDIAIASADLSVWDDHMMVLTADADLPIHFAGGVSALSTRAGQTCAALADAMINGPSQDRIRRLSLLSPYLSEALPADWMKGIPTEAGLFEPEHWARSLETLSPIDGSPIATIVMPVLYDLVDGAKAAAKLGKLLLRGGSLGLWQEALRLAPAAAMEMTLTSLRIADESDPANNVVWTRTADLVGAPRKHMRLLGLSSRSWPRGDNADPLLPEHVLNERALVDLPRLERDRLAFEILTGHPDSKVTLSRSRRSAEGAFLAKSGLLQHRVREYATQLLAGEIPKVLRGAVTLELLNERKAVLRAAIDAFDEITACTIHAFCQQIIMAYAVETGLDPGSRMMDGPAADAMFESVISKWLFERLSLQTREGEDPVAVLSRFEPLKVVKDSFDLAKLKLEHPGAGTVSVDFSLRKDIEFVESVRAFRRWQADIPRNAAPRPWLESSKPWPHSTRTASRRSRALLGYGTCRPAAYCLDEMGRVRF